MTWKIDAPQGNEAIKIRWELVPYTRGRVLDVGCGRLKAFEHFIGIDNGHHAEAFRHDFRPDIRAEAHDLSLFASQSCDAVFSSHLLEHIPYERCGEVLREWWRLLKVGGHLCLYLPSDLDYPLIGVYGASPDHKWNVSEEALDALMAQLNNWDLLECQRRNEGDEYSWFRVYQKTGHKPGYNGTHKEHHFSHRLPKPEKTVAVCRYGAFGDLCMASSVFAGLKKAGFHLTLYTSPPGSDVITHDPHIDRIILQSVDQVPNHLLSDFWAHIAKKYDHFVNLSESVEGSLLAMPGRTHHAWPPIPRHHAMNRNYLQLQHEIAGVPHEPAVRFYATTEEKHWARKERDKVDGPVIVWALAGSSVHKTWPYLDNVIASLMLDFPDCHVYLVGNEAGKLLEQGWEKERRVHLKCGQWSIRQTLSFIEQVDLIIGPETGVLNAAAQLPIPKVVFLSHSTVENLTRDWVQTVSLTSEHTVCKGRGNNDAPACHQMHFGWAHCTEAPLPAGADADDGLRKGMGVAQCQADISFDDAYSHIWTILNDRQSGVIVRA